MSILKEQNIPHGERVSYACLLGTARFGDIERLKQLILQFNPPDQGRIFVKLGSELCIIFSLLESNELLVFEYLISGLVYGCHQSDTENLASMYAIPAKVLLCLAVKIKILFGKST